MEQEETKINFENISLNKTRKKKKNFNDYGLLTKLVKQYKKTEKDEDLLEILQALQGLINTITIIVSPGNPQQQIHLNPYMKKFIYLFLFPEEKTDFINYATYMQGVYRIRWIMRHYYYEDIYNLVISILIDTIKKMKIIEGCDCIYYIQFILKYKLHTAIINHSKDGIVNITEMPNFTNEDEEINEELDRLSYIYGENYLLSEDDNFTKASDIINISVLIKEDDIFKSFTYYEKYIIYLLNFFIDNKKDKTIEITYKQISNILKTNEEDVKERIEDLIYKSSTLNAIKY